jgi:hypothetical protein
MRVSATHLDEFNKYLNGSCWMCQGSGEVERQQILVECPTCLGTGNYCTTEAMIKYFTEPFEPNRKMSLGSAFHAIIENPAKCLKEDFYESNNIKYPKDVIEKALSFLDLSFPKEIKITKEYEIEGLPITLVMVADQAIGRYVIENKTTWRKIVYQKYADSVQWRYYLEGFEADKVIYNAFLFKETIINELPNYGMVLDKGDIEAYEPDYLIEFKDYKQFEFIPFKGMYEQNLELLTYFVQWIIKHNLQKYFLDK